MWNNKIKTVIRLIIKILKYFILSDCFCIKVLIKRAAGSLRQGPAATGCEVIHRETSPWLMILISLSTIIHNSVEFDDYLNLSGIIACSAHPGSPLRHVLSDHVCVLTPARQTAAVYKLSWHTHTHFPTYSQQHVWHTHTHTLLIGYCAVYQAEWANAIAQLKLWNLSN